MKINPFLVGLYRDIDAVVLTSARYRMLSRHYWASRLKTKTAHAPVRL